MRWQSLLGVCGLILAAAGLALAAGYWWRASNRPPAAAGPPDGLAASAPPDDEVVPAQVWGTTQVRFWHHGPPPWPRGNCFALPFGLQVVNMHAENFARAVRDLGLAEVRVRRVGDRHCLVTDPRIPREWLLDRPCQLCTPPALLRRLAEEYPDRFRPAEAAEPGAAPERGGR